MDWLEDSQGPSDQPSHQSETQSAQMDINDAFDMITLDSFEVVPGQLAAAAAAATSAVCAKQKGHKYLSKKKQGKRK